MKPRKTLRKKNKLTSSFYSSFLGVLLIAGILGYFIFVLGTGSIEQKQLETQGVTTQASVIDEKNYFGNSPISREFSYSFEFVIDGRKYTGDTRDSKCQVGDIITIKYVPANPSFNAKSN